MDENHFNDILEIMGSVSFRDTSGVCLCRELLTDLQMATSEASVQLFFVEMNNQLHRALEDAYHHQVRRGGLADGDSRRCSQRRTPCSVVRLGVLRPIWFDVLSRYTVAGTEDAHFMQALTDVYGLQIRVNSLRHQCCPCLF
eukprot:TRINITY_DN9288_c0_g3_i12.p2 TRINITY_DN9288_c0_g3~~TRINITY_DN9288_c0_g3_i12.p2  ORF type:complete len:142 (+),score=17.30 TRINITY_DN9288_c0_g3_i12:1202-1627(+)